MIKDYNGKEIDFYQKLKSPPLIFHTMTHCKEYIVLYGGMSSKDIINGDFYVLKEDESKILIASYSLNKDSTLIIYINHSFSCT